MKNQSADLVVIGGGAAGMFMAATAAEKGLSVILLEHGKYTGKKLRITGKGRCNVTNNCEPLDIIANVPTNGKFLYSALYEFTPSDTMALFERLCVPLKTERGGRVFPVSDKAADVVDALNRWCAQGRVKTIFESATDIEVSDGHVVSVKTSSGEIKCSAAALCTGGASYPLTGSTGDGYKIAKRLGHTIISPKPSLVPLESKDDFCAELQGFSLKNVTLSVYNSKNKLIYEELGEMLFTHFGISGPLVLSASAHMRNFEKEKYYVLIDLKPGLDEQKLDARILRDFAEFSNRNFANALDKLAGRAMIPVLIKRSGIPPEQKVNSITKEQRRCLLELFKRFRIDIDRPRQIEEAIITSGGVSVKEIDPTTMESKLVKGLYFAGEIIDVDAYTGGFNLQIAWSTAHAAGTHAAEAHAAEAHTAKTHI